MRFWPALVAPLGVSPVSGLAAARRLRGQERDCKVQDEQVVRASLRVDAFHPNRQAGRDLAGKPLLGYADDALLLLANPQQQNLGPAFR